MVGLGIQLHFVLWQSKGSRKIGLKVNCHKYRLLTRALDVECDFDLVRALFNTTLVIKATRCDRLDVSFAKHEGPLHRMDGVSERNLKVPLRN